MARNAFGLIGGADSIAQGVRTVKVVAAIYPSAFLFGFERWYTHYSVFDQTL